MTRKRFVKLLMAERFDRNEANLWADYYNMMGIRYAEAYEDMKPYLCSHLILWNGNRTLTDEAVEITLQRLEALHENDR